MTTATVEKPALHEFEGREVHRATVAIRNAGDGLSEGLAIAPDEVKQDEQRYYVIKAECSAVNFKTDKKGITTREHVMNAASISPIDSDTAEEFLTDYAEMVQRRKDEVTAQLRFDDLEKQEQAAEEREVADDSDTPNEIAEAAAKRAREGR